MTLKFLEHRPFQLKDSAVCIGKFDGLHSGHRLLVDSLHKYEQFQKVLFTFSFGEAETIYSEEEKRFLAEKLGIDVYINCPFSEEICHMSPKEFLEDILIRQCGARAISVGEDFRFGFERSGDVAFLREQRSTYGYELNVFPKKKLLGDVVSSTRIRQELKKGTIERVNRLLGEPYFIRGTVRHGNQIGRTLNMPTANLVPPREKILPAFGVYASKVWMDGVAYTGVTNIGIKPTIPGENQAGVETFIMDFDLDIYGKELCVELYAFLRGEKKFSGLEALKAQMEDDKKNAYLFFEQ